MDNYKIFLAKLQHYDDYLQIRSEKKNLYWTGYIHPPDYDKFLTWYKERLKDSDRHIYLIYGAEECLGALHIDYYDEYATIGYSVKEAHEGKGIAKRLVSEVIKLVSIRNKKYHSISSVIAWINESNVASKKVVEKNGFKKSVKSEMRWRHGKEERYDKYIRNI